MMSWKFWEKFRSPPDLIEVDTVYVSRNNPFDSGVRVLELKRGWVKYIYIHEKGIEGGTNALRERDFRQLYERGAE